MDSNIRFATEIEKEALREIFLGFNMDLAGDIEEHVVLKRGETIFAGGKLSLLERNLFHLEVFGVKDEHRGTGAGSLLLTSLLRNPWQFCRSHALEAGETFWVTTVSRGEAVPFYTKHGFQKCDFSDLAWPYDEQCETCPDREDCQPVPMVFKGGERTCNTQ